MSKLKEFHVSSWDEEIPEFLQSQAIQELEEGKVLFFPELAFSLQSHEKEFLSADKADPKRKNISYDIKSDQVGGTLASGEEKERLKAMLKRYALTSSHFMNRLFPRYSGNLTQARTSFRPVEIQGRKSPSIRKDDTRLHVDAFPATPTNGLRILRLFTNVNPEGKPRVWRVGEPFIEVVKQFGPSVPKPLPGSAYLLKMLKITKQRRSLYDHYMLHIHNQMKEDDRYQSTVSQEEIHFPVGSSWMVFTDQVSHAALAGQHVLEQTFALTPAGLMKQKTSPLAQLEKFFNQSLTHFTQK